MNIYKCEDCNKKRKTFKLVGFPARLCRECFGKWFKVMVKKDEVRAVNNKSIMFVQGYVCAIANIVRYHGNSTEVREALKAIGVTRYLDFRKYKIEQYDRETLRPIVEQIRRERRLRNGKAAKIE